MAKKSSRKDFKDDREAEFRLINIGLSTDPRYVEKDYNLNDKYVKEKQKLFSFGFDSKKKDKVIRF